jgi:ABC-type uncharacterized transport system auxiliary subunit
MKELAMGKRITIEISEDVECFLTGYQWGDDTPTLAEAISDYLEQSYKEEMGELLNDKEDEQ